MNQNFFTQISDYVVKYTKESLIGLAAIGLLGGGIYYYLEQKRTQEQQAQHDFATVLQDVKQGGKNAWADIELASQAGITQHKNAQVGAYFHALQADALLASGKVEEAYGQLADLMLRIPKNSPLYSVFAIKTALVGSQLDAHKEASFKSLNELAAAEDNLQRDEALYYLGFAYEAQGNHAQAEATWKQLVTLFSKDAKFGASPWAELAQQRLG